MAPSRAGTEAIRTHTCDFEDPGDLCGWQRPTDIQGLSGVASAERPPTLGPSVDTNPGVSTGEAEGGGGGKAAI